MQENCENENSTSNMFCKPTPKLVLISGKLVLTAALKT